MRIFNKIDLIISKIRTNFYKKMFKSFGAKSRVLGRIKVYYPENIVLGNLSTLNEGVVLNARGGINIGSHVHISPGVIVNTGSLDYTKTRDLRKHIAKTVLIEDGVWIGSGAIINPGVKIGKNSVIGAGSVVTKDIPENCLAVGVPARVIKTLKF